MYVEGVNRKSRILFNFQLLLIDDNEMSLTREICIFSCLFRARLRVVSVLCITHGRQYSPYHSQ